MGSSRHFLRVLGRVLALLAFFASLSACQSLKPKPPRPWDRDILARPEMQPDVDAMETLMDEKIYFSKEATRGGASIGGGGCGCN
jgi:hypothetical protein